MAKRKYVPIVSHPERASALATFLLDSQFDGGVPFDWPEPFGLLVRTLRGCGWDLAFDYEDLARVLLMHTLLDGGVDSILLTASVARELTRDPGKGKSSPALLVDPTYYLDFWDDAASSSALFLRNTGHMFGYDLATQMPKLFHNIGEFWGSRALSIFTGSNGHTGQVTAPEIVATLVSTQGDWQLNHPSRRFEGISPELGNGDRRKLFPGVGVKKAKLAVMRAVANGIAAPPSLPQIGIPVDVHALLVSCCVGAITFEKEVTRDHALKVLNALWESACSEHSLDVVELYRRVWLWGRRYCRLGNCQYCPMRKAFGDAKGRLATGGYYNRNGGRWIYPEPIAMPVQGMLGFDEEFWRKNAPEAVAPGLTYRGNEWQFIRYNTGLDLQLPLDMYRLTPNEAIEEDDEDPFRVFDGGGRETLPA